MPEADPTQIDALGLNGKWVLDLARATAAVANYCDHAEHNEFADRDWITEAARTLRRLALEIAATNGIDIIDSYAGRLQEIERLNVLWSEASLDGARLVLECRTWRALQLAQVEHDRQYHPDVIGLSKLDQLRHYAFHMAKLTGALAENLAGIGDQQWFSTRRLPDLLLFGVKLSTVVGERLNDEGLPPRPSGHALGM